MKKLTLLLTVGIVLSCSAPTSEQPAASESSEPQPVEFGDAKYIEMTKAALPAMVNQDLDAFVSGMADDAVYIFNAGDTLKGKAAIREFWGGRMEAIEQISFDNDVWLGVKVNDSQNVIPGNWVMAWMDVNATYTSGGSMSQSVHTLYHYTDNDQVDMVIQYLDRVPIMQAEQAAE